MKKILILLSIVLVGFFVKGQSPTFPVPSTGGGLPIKQFLGNDSTLIGVRGISWSKYGAVNGIYTDTTQANTTRIDQYPGAQIFTTNDTSIWLRTPLANRWVRPKTGSGSISSFNFLSDSTLIICYSDGSCDTIPLINFSDIVTNIINNNGTSTTINGDTIIQCRTIGAITICDTQIVGFNIYNSYYINDSMRVVCDSPQVVIGLDTSYVVQNCDTITFPPIVTLIVQSGLEKTSNILWQGALTQTLDNPNGGPNSSWFQRPTTTNTFVFNHLETGFPVMQPVFQVFQQQEYALGSDIAAFLSQGLEIPEAFGYHNRNRYRIGYFGNLYSGGGSDTVIAWGYGGKNFSGYYTGTNIYAAAAGGIVVDDQKSKWGGMFIHDKDTATNDAIDFIGSRPSNTQFIGGSLASDTTTLPNKIILTLFTNKGIRAYGYGSGSSFITTDTSTNKPAAFDANGNFVRMGYWPSGDGGYFSPNQTSSGATTHNANFNNFLVNNINISEYTAGVSGNYTLIHQDSALISLYALHNTGAISSDLWIRPDSIRLLPFQGKLNIDTLQIGTSTDSVMVWNKTTGRVGYRNASSFGISGITADNGLTANTSTNVQLGGTLIQATTITGSDQNFVITNTRSGYTYALEVLAPGVNNKAGLHATGSDYAIYAEGSARGVYGSGNAYGLIGFSANGNALQGFTNDGIAILAQAQSTAGSGIQTMINVVRDHIAAASNGVGGSIDFKFTNTGGTNNLANQIISKWTDVTLATRTSQFIITGVNSATTQNLAIFNGNGTMQWPQYGAGTLTTDGSGNITATSDKRVKHDIRPMTYGLKEVLKLEPSTFIYNNDASNTVMPGFIAQNVKQTFNGLGVGQDKSGMLTLNNNVVIAALTNAIKELNQKIIEQQKQTDDLKKNNKPH